MSRHLERETVFTLLYEYTYYDGEDALAFLKEREAFREENFSDYINDTFTEAVSSVSEIDKSISEFAVGWKLSRMSKITKSILRLAVYEIRFTDAPPKAIINEAVELAKAYDEEKSAGFVNGILNKIARSEGKITDDTEETDAE